MTRIKTMIGVAAMLSACTQPKDQAAESRSALDSSNIVSSPWEGRLGHVVTVQGRAEDAKLGALLVMGSATIWMDGLDAWPAEVRGKRVEVTGKVIVKADLPVFVPREGEPQMQGMPLPPGTDLEKAQRRFLLIETRWNALE